MKPQRRAGQVYLEDFEKLTLEDIRRMVGGRRKFHETQAVTVHLPDGRNVYVPFIRTPANLGGGELPWLKCPVEGCHYKVRILRLVPDDPGLMCQRCMRRTYGAAYLSQQRPRVGEMEGPAI